MKKNELILLFIKERKNISDIVEGIADLRDLGKREGFLNEKDLEQIQKAIRSLLDAKDSLYSLIHLYKKEIEKNQQKEPPSLDWEQVAVGDIIKVRFAEIGGILDGQEVTGTVIKVYRDYLKLSTEDTVFIVTREDKLLEVDKWR